MKKLRLIPLLLALSLSGCLAPKTDDSQNNGTQDNVGENNNNQNTNDNQGGENNQGGETNQGGESGNNGGETNQGDTGENNQNGNGDGDNTGNEDENPMPTDYISKVKLNANSDFSTYENKTFAQDKISLVTLKEVIDGDDIHFYEGNNTIQFRLAYIDAPEINAEYGQQAKTFVKGLIEEAKTIVITNISLSSTGEALLDSTGERYVGFVWYANKANATLNELRCLNLDVVYEGFSQERTSSSSDPLRSNFLYCQSSAQQAKKNIWTNYVPALNDFGYDHYDGYYGTLTWENGEDLKQKLYTIIHDGYTALPYKTPNWETNQFADQDLYNHDEVNLVYSNDNLAKTFTSKQGNGGWQREHAFCASLMTGSLSATAVDTLGRATDFHNLFAASETGNTSRGNKNFGVANPTDSSYQSTGHYKCDSKNFEPSDFDKGRLARAIFYMGVMYSVSENPAYQPLTIVEDYVDYTAGNCKYSIGNLSTLLTWNYFNVDYLEYQHNESVYSHVYSGTNKAQGNRNPFVDYPGLVDYVFGDKQSQAGDIKNLCPTETRLETSNDGIHHYAIKDVKTSYMVGEQFDSNCYTLMSVDWKLKETPAPASADKTVPYTFVTGDIGKKNLTVDTDLNDIVIKSEVTEYKDTFDIAECKYYSGEPLTSKSYETQLANAKTTLVVDGDVTISQYSNNGIKIPKTFNSITLTSDSLENIDKIGIKTNGNKNGKYQIQIKVGSDEVYKETLTGLGTGVDPMESLVKLDSPINGVVTIVITPVSSCDAVYIATLGINAD